MSWGNMGDRMEKTFKGVYVALITPFNEEEKVCVPRLRKLVNFLLSRGVHGFYVCGSTGEGLLMSSEERKKVAEIVKDMVKEKAKIIVHVGAMTTREAVELAQHAERIGLDAVASIPPFYYPYSFQELKDYYRRIADSTSLPLFIYYIPSTTHLTLENRQFMELAEIQRIKGIKYTHPDLFLFQNLILRLGDRWVFFSGLDELFLPALVVGADGCIGSTQNILPEIFLEIYRSFQKGDWNSARELQKKVNRVITLLKRFGWSSWKFALRFRGLDGGYPREPLRKTLHPEEENIIRKEWENLFPPESLPL